nr:hypothetical protein [Pseudolysinimonas kribbensis]
MPGPAPVKSSGESPHIDPFLPGSRASSCTFDAAMNADGVHDRAGDEFTLKDDLRVVESERRVSRGDSRRIADAITCACRRRAVELVPVRLDHDPFLDEEVDAADSGDDRLEAESEPELDQQHPDQRLEPRLRAGIRHGERAVDRRRASGELARLDEILPEGTVDGRHELAEWDAGRRLGDRLGRGHRRARGGGIRRAPMADGRRRSTSRPVWSELDVNDVPLDHPHAQPSQFRDAGEPSPGSNGPTRQRIQAGEAEDAVTKANDLPDADRAPDPSVASTERDDLSASHHDIP